MYLQLFNYATPTICRSANDVRTRGEASIDTDDANFEAVNSED
jgi:hypothetical protein